MDKLGMKRLPLLLGIAAGAAVIGGAGMEVQSGTLSWGVVLGISGVAVIELSVAVAAIDGKLRSLFRPKFSMKEKPIKSTQTISFANPEPVAIKEILAEEMNKAIASASPGPQLSVASHPSLGQVALNKSVITLKNTAGGIYIDSMDSVKPSLMKAKDFAKKPAEQAETSPAKPVLTQAKDLKKPVVVQKTMGNEKPKIMKVKPLKEASSIKTKIGAKKKSSPILRVKPKNKQ